MLTFARSFSGVPGAVAVAEEALPPSIDAALAVLRQRLEKESHNAHYPPHIRTRIRQYVLRYSPDPNIESTITQMSMDEIIELAITMPVEV